MGYGRGLNTLGSTCSSALVRQRPLCNAGIMGGQLNCAVSQQWPFSCFENWRKALPAFEPVPLDFLRIRESAGVLERAFADDPGLHFVLPDPTDRVRLGPLLAATVVRYAVRCGSPMSIGDPIRGLALWFAPDDPEPSTLDLLETGISLVPEQIGPGAWTRFGRMLEHVDALHPLYAPGPHWYLAMIGVDPLHQGQGVGVALMQPVLARADRVGMACYLETPNLGTSDSTSVAGSV